MMFAHEPAAHEHVEIENIGDLEQFINMLKQEKDRNAITSMLVRCKNRAVDRDIKQRLGQALTHPYAKIHRLCIVEARQNALYKSFATKHVKQWCKGTPATSHRLIQLWLRSESTETSRPILDDLTEAFTFPGNGVEELDIFAASSKLQIGEKFLRPVLESPNNALLRLRLQEFDELRDDDAVSLWKGLTSTACKLMVFENDFTPMTFSSALLILDGLSYCHHLQRLQWSHPSSATLTERDKPYLLSSIAGLMSQPGNTLRSLKLAVYDVKPSDVAILAKALTSENCRVDDFEGYLTARPNELELRCQLFLALRHPKCPLRSIKINCEDGSHVADILRESLEDPNCKLEALTISSGRSYIIAKSIAKALATAASSRLKHLTFDLSQSSSVLHDFATSLRSRSNNLRTLGLRIESIGGRHNNFYASLCKSSVVSYSIHPSNRFSEAFNGPFQVLHTLLSVKFVQRLGKNAWVSIIPIQDLILQISNVLGWPLEIFRFDQHY